MTPTSRELSSVTRKFTPEEDQKLRELVEKYGCDDWKTIASEMPNRNVKQCRERWQLYLNPNINQTPWTPEEDAALLKLYDDLGPRWSRIVSYFPGRTTINIKNHYNALARKNRKAQNSSVEKFQEPVVSLQHASPQIAENRDSSDFSIFDCEEIMQEGLAIFDLQNLDYEYYNGWGLQPPINIENQEFKDIDYLFEYSKRCLRSGGLEYGEVSYFSELIEILEKVKSQNDRFEARKKEVLESRRKESQPTETPRNRSTNHQVSQLNR